MEKLKVEPCECAAWSDGAAAAAAAAAGFPR